MKHHSVEFKPVGRCWMVGEGRSLLDTARALGVGMSGICDGRESCQEIS